MIYRLRKKFIKICLLSFLAVFLVLITLIFVTTSLQTDKTLDKQADLISENNGRFPDFSAEAPEGETPLPPAGFHPESPFTTRYFTVRYDESGAILRTDIGQIASVTAEEAEAYAEKALEAGSERGWIDDYRYKLYPLEGGQGVIFVNGAELRENNRSFLLGTLSVFALCSLLIIVLIVLISGQAVKPAAESYEKQKQFVTNAGHELKTPLTLIRTNLDILEEETGENEWLSDIRDETLLMSELVTRMVALARMDEEEMPLKRLPFDLSSAVEDTVSAFAPAIERSGRRLSLSLAEGVLLQGDEASLRQVISILMDNALKYCDEGGEISVSLTPDRHPSLSIENSYAAAESISLDRLFDRFYREDKARTSGSGFGIGLSVAKATVERHRGSIVAYCAGGERLGFRIKLP